MLAAEECTRLLEAVADDAVPQCAHIGASAWIAHSKLSKDVCLTVVNHLKRLVVIVPTDFADSPLALLCLEFVPAKIVCYALAASDRITVRFL